MSSTSPSQTRHLFSPPVFRQTTRARDANPRPIGGTDETQQMPWRTASLSVRDGEISGMQVGSVCPAQKGNNMFSLHHRLLAAPAKAHSHISTFSPSTCRGPSGSGVGNIYQRVRARESIQQTHERVCPVKPCRLNQPQLPPSLCKHFFFFFTSLISKFHPGNSSLTSA